MDAPNLPPMNAEERARRAEILAWGLTRAIDGLMSWTMRDGTRCGCPLGKNEGEPNQPRLMPTLHATCCAEARAALARWQIHCAALDAQGVTR